MNVPQRVESPNAPALVLSPRTESVSISIRYDSNQFDSEKLFAEFAKLPGFVRFEEGARVRGTLAPGNLLANGHGHLGLHRGEGVAEVEVRFELISGPHMETLPAEISLEGALELLRQLTPVPESANSRLASGDFAFSLKHWEPTIPLPFAPTSGNMPGLAKICGLDIAFLEFSEKQPILRAFLGAYEDVDTIGLSLLLRIQFDWSSASLIALLETFEAQLPVFVRSRSGDRT